MNGWKEGNGAIPSFSANGDRADGYTHPNLLATMAKQARYGAHETGMWKGRGNKVKVRRRHRHTR